jgi:hypothetical protein
MHDIVLSKDFETLNQLTEYLQCSFLIDCPLSFYQLQQCPALAILINEIAIISSLQQLVKANNIGARFKLVMDGQLVIDAFFDFGIFCQDLVAYHLDGEEIGVFKVPGLEDLTVGTTAQKI